jgi:hypothetical protein
MEWRMRKRLLLIGLPLILVALAVLLWARDRYAFVSPHTTYSDAELQKMFVSADNGDLEASWRLHNYYAFVAHSPKDMEKWLQVGAKRNDERSIYTLAFFYATAEAPYRNLEKASYWADNLEKIDPEEAKVIRREIERVRSE